MTTFQQELVVLVLDKLAIGFLILIAAYYLNRLLEKFKGEQALRREYEALRNETTLTHIQRQIEELYSPLHGLITQSRLVYDIAMRKLPHIKDGQARPEDAAIWAYFGETYFIPINRQMAELIRSKVYLIPTDEFPECMTRFLIHQTTFEYLNRLYRDKGVSSDEIAGSGWPQDFGEYVKDTLTQLRKRYNEYLSRVERAE